MRRDDDETVVQAARDAGGYAEAVAGVDADAAAPIPRDATDLLEEPGTGSSAPADSVPTPLDADDVSGGSDRG